MIFQRGLNRFVADLNLKNVFWTTSVKVLSASVFRVKGGGIVPDFSLGSNKKMNFLKKGVKRI